MDKMAVASTMTTLRCRILSASFYIFGKRVAEDLREWKDTIGRRRNECGMNLSLVSLSSALKLHRDTRHMFTRPPFILTCTAQTSLSFIISGRSWYSLLDYL